MTTLDLASTTGRGNDRPAIDDIMAHFGPTGRDLYDSQAIDLQAIADDAYGPVADFIGVTQDIPTPWHNLADGHRYAWSLLAAALNNLMPYALTDQEQAVIKLQEITS